MPLGEMKSSLIKSISNLSNTFSPGTSIWNNDGEGINYDISMTPFFGFAVITEVSTYTRETRSIAKDGYTDGEKGFAHQGIVSAFR